jgi:hypothetical protein
MRDKFDLGEGELTRERFEALLRELERLRAQVAQLRARNTDLVRDAVNRQYERPPHYE